MKERGRPNMKKDMNRTSSCILWTVIMRNLWNDDHLGEYRVKHKSKNNISTLTIIAPRNAEIWNVLNPVFAKNRWTNKFHHFFQTIPCHEIGRNICSVALKKINWNRPICFFLWRIIRTKVKELEIKLQRLLDGYLDQDMRQTGVSRGKSKIVIWKEVAGGANTDLWTKAETLARTDKNG